jgi:multicomponent Na+:H+ antiporter subunit D
MNFNTIAFIPIMILLLSSGILMFSKTLNKSPLRQFLFTGALSLAWILSGISTIALIWYLRTRGNFIVWIGSYHEEVAISYKFTMEGALIFFVALLITFLSWAYDRKLRRNRAEFSIILFIQLFSIGATLFTRDLFNLFVALEIMGISSYVLIAFSSKIRSSLASLTYLLLSSTAMVFFLLGCYTLYRITGSLHYEVIRETLGKGTPSIQIYLSASFIIIAIILRSALFPLHFWLPNAHAMAMHPVSAILSGVLIKIPLLALTPIVLLFPFSQTIGQVIKVCGALSALVAVLFAFCQSDIKKLLAYHSISQLGYIAAAWGFAIELTLETKEGMFLYLAAMIHIIFHALFKSTLFLSCGVLIDATHTRDVYALRNGSRTLLAQSKRHIVTIFSFFVAALSITAIPFFNGYYSKNLITSSFHHQWIYPVLFITGIFTVASFIKLSRIFLPSKRAPVNTSASPTTSTFSLTVLSLLLIFTALFSQKIIQLIFTYVFMKEYVSPVLFYGYENWVKAGITIISGLLLFLSIRLPWVAKIMHSVDSYEPKLEIMFLSLFFCIAGMSLYLLR